MSNQSELLYEKFAAATEGEQAPDGSTIGANLSPEARAMLVEVFYPASGKRRSNISAAKKNTRQFRINPKR
jgi:hypothetical protein